MSNSLLVEFYGQIPEGRSSEKPKMTRKEAIEVFRHRVAERYSEGTLLRLLESGDSPSRRTALLALSSLGTMDANSAIAAQLSRRRQRGRSDGGRYALDVMVPRRQPANDDELQHLARFRDRGKALAGLDALILRAPLFAEAYNQRAIVHFRLKQFERSIADCERVLELNPHHFGVPKPAWAKVICRSASTERRSRHFATPCESIRTWTALRKLSALWKTRWARKAGATIRNERTR